MTNQEIAEKYVTCLNDLDTDCVAEMLADDFTFSGPVPETLDREGYLDYVRNICRGFPDIKYNAKLISVGQEEMLFSHQLAGTHTKDLDLQFVGLGVIAPTGKFILNAEETGKAVITGGKIHSIHVPLIENGGLPAILRHLGVEGTEMRGAA